MNNHRQKDQLWFGANNVNSTLGTKICNTTEIIISTSPCSRHGHERLKYEVSQATLDPEFMNGSTH